MTDTGGSKPKQKRHASGFKAPELYASLATATEARAYLLNAPELPIDRSLEKLRQATGKHRLCIDLKPAKALARQALYDAVLRASGRVWNPGLEEAVVSRNKRQRKPAASSPEAAWIEGRGTLQDDFGFLATEFAHLRSNLGQALTKFDLLRRTNQIRNALESAPSFTTHSQAFLDDLHKHRQHLSAARESLSYFDRVLGKLAEHRHTGGAPASYWFNEFTAELMLAWNGMTGKIPGQGNKLFTGFLNEALLSVSDFPYDSWESSVRAAKKLVAQRSN